MKKINLTLVSILLISVSSCKKVENTIQEKEKILMVSTLAGATNAGFADGDATHSAFYTPVGISMDASGNIFVADKNNHRIRKVTPAGVVSTFAGGEQGFADGAGTAAQFYQPVGIVIDPTGNLYVAEGNHCIRKITPSGVVTTFAGVPGEAGFQDGPAATAKFSSPIGLGIDPSGNIIVADSDNNRIRKISQSGLVSTVAGSGESANFTYKNGPAATATFGYPNGVAIDPKGNIYVTTNTSGLKVIRKITPDGMVSTFAGAGKGYADGFAPSALFQELQGGITIDALGNMYIADYGMRVIRKITPDMTVYTIAGIPRPAADAQPLPLANGVSKLATFGNPYSIIVSPQGDLYVSDGGFHCIRKITSVDKEDPITQNQLDKANWNKPTGWK